jgi:hypothetical protein
MAAKLGRLTGHTSDYWLRAAFPRGAINGARTKSMKAAAASVRPLGQQIRRAYPFGCGGH